MPLRPPTPLRLRWGLAGVVFALLLGKAAADEPVHPACPALLPEESPWIDRAASIQRHARLPEACLKALVRECADRASHAFLDGDSAIVCSVRYEALLHHRFDGDFAALLQWWRGQRR